MKTQIGLKLRRAREAKRYTQDEVAALLGVTRSTYTHYETGHTPPDIETLFKLSEIFGESVACFLGLATGTLADLPPPILETVELMRRLDKDRQEDVLDFARYIAGKQTDESS